MCITWILFHRDLAPAPDPVHGLPALTSGWWPVASNLKFGRVAAVRFRALVAGEMLPFTLIVRDPVGNSFIGSTEHENPADDPNIEVRRGFIVKFDAVLCAR